MKAKVIKVGTNVNIENNDKALTEGYKVVENENGTITLFQGTVNKIPVTIIANRKSKNDVYTLKNSQYIEPVNMQEEFYRDYILRETSLEKNAPCNKGKRKFAPMIIEVLACENAIKVVREFKEDFLKVKEVPSAERGRAKIEMLMQRKGF